VNNDLIEYELLKMPTLELKTSIEVEKSMKLIDINGKKINFQSDCIVKGNPKNPFKIAIVNQNELDNGDINFEVCSGNFSRRVTYESADNEHLNHYIAFKKMPNDENAIKAEVIVQLTELEMDLNPKLTLNNESNSSPVSQTNLYSPVSQPNSQLYSPVSQPNSQLYSPVSQPNSQLYSPVSQQEDPEVDILKQKLYELSQNNEYKTQNSFYRYISIGCFILLILFVVLKK